MRKSGFILVSILWVITLLSFVILGFGKRVTLDRRASAYSLDVSEARLLAHSAVQRGIIELRNKAIIDVAEAEEKGGGTHLGQPWAQPKSLIKDLHILDWGENRSEDDVFYIITDEESKINLNSTAKEILEEVQGINRGVIRQIIKRRTESVHQDEGISPFQVEEELRYLRGVKDEDWFGTSKTPGLKDMFTVHGSGRINLNTASEKVLKCIPKLGDRAIETILNYRAGADGTLGTGDDKGFRSVQEVMDVTGLAGDPIEAIKQYCTFYSSCFRIKGYATLRNGKIRVACTAIVYIESTNASLIRWQEETFGI
ncbi:MAG TPA: type II secretion system protein GspK [Candidatus Hydrogenedens sp.]|nr:type II secretion system protein GspK [Candidatus Hydrogenedens sp.]HOL18735.1 type II secretion system protein GspK [Candidatus Hydrogenedens sp.]HPP59115.1 type II secretion system protein GspK [Candidatus Hydrogenedens sp.]